MLYIISKEVRSLTSDYTESGRWRSVSQEMWSRRCDTAEMCEMRRFWRVGTARNAMFFHSFALRWLGKSAPKNGRARGLGYLDVARICTTPASENDLEVKIVKNWHVRESQIAKICTTPARESDLEVKTVKAPGARTTFWDSKCFSRGRRKDFDTLQNTWQAQEFVRVAKTLAGVVGLKRVRNDAFRIQGRVANFLLRKSYFAGIISRGDYRSSYASAQLFRGKRSTFEAST